MGETFDLSCALGALARKYRGLLALREGSEPFHRETLRELSREFPGALRELDALPFTELATRLNAVERARTGGGARDAWIDWMLAYHRSMRAALSIRAELGSEREPDPALAERLARELGAEADAEFVRGVANPPAGRLNELVFGRLAAHFGRPAREIERRLFRAEVSS